jgi:D-alanyl-D-alanine carboxypeptidase/D-alanyl-D-alanine-endopeptidase (penicillin-binding protein 4)
VAPPLARKIDTVLKRPEYRNARWGILAVNSTTGKVVHELNSEELFAPASVTKLFSCAAAWFELGPDHRFETPVYYRGTLADGTLKGDLILVGKGDLTLGGRTDRSGKMAFSNDDHIYASASSTGTAVTDTNPLAGLEDLAGQVKAAGINSVTGDVLVDERLFERARGSGSGPDVLSPVVVNDNIVDVIVSPASKEGEPGTYRLRPQTPFLQIDVQVNTVAKGKRVNIVTHNLGSGRYTVRGQIPVGARPAVRICAVDDPGGFARALFIDALRRAGVEVKASVLRPPTAELPEEQSYAKLTRVAVLHSPPLSEAIKVTLKVSHNLYASTLPLLLAVKHGKRTLAEGMRLQGKALAKLGVTVGSISLESGAGGGNGDKVSPRVTVELLQALRKRPDWPAFETCLPVLGTDGTLAAVGKDSPARGKVRGKTGTYTDRNLLLGRAHLRAKTLAGTMTTDKGDTVLYAIFINDAPLPGSAGPLRDARAIGQVAEMIQQMTPGGRAEEE